MKRAALLSYQHSIAIVLYVRSVAQHSIAYQLAFSSSQQHYTGSDTGAAVCQLHFFHVTYYYSTKQPPSCKRAAISCPSAQLFFFALLCFPFQSERKGEICIIVYYCISRYIRGTFSPHYLFTNIHSILQSTWIVLVLTYICTFFSMYSPLQNETMIWVLNYKI